MKKIDLYIIRKFLSTFIFIIALLMIVIVVFDFSEKIDDFINNEAPLKAILFDYYLNFLPYLLNLYSPLIIFIAAIYFTSRMAYNTEIVAIFTTGTSFYRLIVPYFVVAFMLAGISYYLNGWVIPRGNKHLVEFESQYINLPTFARNVKIHKKLKEGEFIFVKNYNRSNNSGTKFTLEEFEGIELKKKLFAEQLHYIDSSEKWIAINYKIRYIDSLDERIETGDTLLLDIKLNPMVFNTQTINIKMMNNQELDDFIEQKKYYGDSQVDVFIVERYQRSSIPFSTFILVIMAMSLASRKVRGGTGLHLGLGILLVFTYILFFRFSTQFAIQSSLDPILSVWIPNILYLFVAIILLKFAQK